MGTIQIKRKFPGSGAPPSLKSGEPAVNADGKIYVGIGDDGSGNATAVVQVADKLLITDVLSKLQSDHSDTTDNAIMRVVCIRGSFGVGAMACPNIEDLDATDTPAGLYSVVGSFTQGTIPSGASGFGACLVLRYNSTDFVQIYYGVTTDAMWVRRHRTASGGFQSWERMDNAAVKTQVFTSFGASVTVTNTPIDKDHVEVFFDGVFQDPADYTLATRTITFTAGAPAGISKILVRYWHY